MKMELSVYNPRANRLPERSVQAWSRYLNMSIGAFLQRAQMADRNTSKARSKTPAEFLLGRE